MFAELKKAVLKYKNKDFLEAVMAGAALIALADGQISSEEEQKMIRFIESHEALSVFSIKEAIKSFQSFVAQIQFDKDAGEAKAYRSLIKLNGNKEEAKFVMKMIISIAQSDGNFDANEKIVAKKIAKELKQNPSKFNLAPWYLSLVYRIRGLR